MLREALTYLTTPCDPRLRTMGYLKELIATEARFRRCRAAWRPHLDATRSVIADAVARTPRRGKAVVLGAGILCDIPIDALADGFETVVLVDACFLGRTRRGLRHRANIDWRTADITGLALPLCTGALPTPDIPAAPTLADADLAVSANVLSQLPLLPVAHLHKTHPALDEDALAAFARDIAVSHLAWLDTCPGTVCLISELEREIVADDRVLATEDPLWGAPFAAEGREWLWDMAPVGEIAPDYGIRNRVRGIVRSGT